MKSENIETIYPCVLFVVETVGLGAPVEVGHMSSSSDIVKSTIIGLSVTLLPLLLADAELVVCLHCFVTGLILK